MSSSTTTRSSFHLSIWSWSIRKSGVRGVFLPISPSYSPRTGLLSILPSAFLTTLQLPCSASLAYFSDLIFAIAPHVTGLHGFDVLTNLTRLCLKNPGNDIDGGENVTGTNFHQICSETYFLPQTCPLSVSVDLRGHHSIVKLIHVSLC